MKTELFLPVFIQDLFDKRRKLLDLFKANPDDKKRITNELNTIETRLKMIEEAISNELRTRKRP